MPYDIEDIPFTDVQSYLETRILRDFDPDLPFGQGREWYLLRRNSGELPDVVVDKAPNSNAELPGGMARKGERARVVGEPTRRLRLHRRSLLALQEHLRGLAAERAGVLPFGQFRMFAGQIEEVDREFPGLLPTFVTDDYFAERFPSGDHYNISTMLTYLGSALARIEAELAGTPLTLEGLHPEIVAAAGALFADGHNAPAIFEAFKAVEVRVRKQSGLHGFGRDLMARALGGGPPPIRITTLEGRSGQDEQEGFKLIFMGSIQGIRNPKGHEPIEQTDPLRTLEYLAFASLLMRRLDDAAGA